MLNSNHNGQKKKTKIRTKNQQKVAANIVDINPTVSIITLNNNGLNAQIKPDCQSESKIKTQLYVV